MYIIPVALGTAAVPVAVGMTVDTKVVTMHVVTLVATVFGLTCVSSTAAAIINKHSTGNVRKCLLGPLWARLHYSSVEHPLGSGRPPRLPRKTEATTWEV